MSGLDALVVGAGPAGTTLAILLARAGARVAILERKHFPRDKLCGEFVSPEALRILGRAGVLDELARTAGRAREFLVTDLAGRSVRLPLPAADGREALGIPRREMDAALLERASREGVIVHEGLEVRRVLFDAGRAAGVAATARGDSADRVFAARLLFAADGRDSTLARQLAPRDYRGRSSPMFGVKAHFTGVAGIGGAVELHYFKGGYVGLHEIGERLVNVCALIDRSLARPCPHDPERIVQELFYTNAAARARLEPARRVSDWFAVGSLVFRAERPDRSGVLFLGDAAGTIDPFAGEGISMALRSAEIAAEETLRALGGAPGDPRDLPRRYTARWRREFTSRIAICRAIGRLTTRPALQRPVISLIERFPAVGRVLAHGTRTGVRPVSGRSA